MTQRAGRAGHEATPNAIKPLYKRLPHGPHRLDRDQVILHQRARIHGAMVEAVAECGYEDTSVKQVISLAGVSRRSFYEQFSNKQESFLATFDLLAHQTAQRSRNAYTTAEGGLEERLGSAFGQLADTARDERKPTILVMLEAQTAGPPGTMRLCKGIATCEQMLSLSFADDPHADPLPTPIVRAIAGGLHGAASQVIRRGPIENSAELAEEMLRWTMLFQAPAAAQLADRLAPRLSRRMREISATSPRAAVEVEPTSADDREQLMLNALRLATTHEYRELTAPHIADEAGLSIDIFLQHFAGKNECYLAGFDMIGDELLALVADPELTSSDWPRAVRRTVARLMRHLAEEPLHARTIAQEAFFAGGDAVQRDLDLARGIVALLSAGAPGAAQSEFVLDGIAGAIWHTIRCQVASGRIQLLDALSDYVSYIVLTPFIGAQEASEIVTEELVA
ncbi:MAG TPA: TetR/AcrR family transcriptional regulator [Solirubrobacteraceae bacterium]|nr:TetR/AcrR family transcriptional regulator [Solirubrobacteraceae bacterium]